MKSISLYYLHQFRTCQSIYFTCLEPTKAYLTTRKVCNWLLAISEDLKQLILTYYECSIYFLSFKLSFGWQLAWYLHIQNLRVKALVNENTIKAINMRM
jgi:hypothetical protein